MTLVAGSDACRGGWVAILLDRGAFAGALFADTFGRFLEEVPEAAAIGVDIPIGLPESGLRAGDIAARSFVGPRHSSVFATPPRVAVTASSYAEARQLVPSLSAQSFALGRKILEVEHQLEERVIEVHPEVSFAALAGGHLRHSKRTWNGQMERRRLLAGAGIELPDELASGPAAADDVLDAAAVAWSANRYAHGEAAPLPSEPPLRSGRPIAIWY